MFAYCLSDGMTCSMKVYRRGDIFVLPSMMEGEFGGLSPSHLVSKQRKIYRKELFRWPTDEEIVMGYRDGKVNLDLCSPREQLIIANSRGKDGTKLTDAAKVLKDKVLKEHPELVEEDDGELVKDAEVHAVIEADKPAPSKPIKPTRTRRTSTRKTKKE